MKVFNTFRRLFRVRKTKIGLIIVVTIGLFIACWAWLPYVIVGFAALWEFFGQSINAKSSKYYYTVGETVGCQITYHVSQSDKYIYIEIFDDESGVVVASEIISPLIVYGYHDVYYNEYQPNNPGYYKCRAQIKDTGEEKFGWQGSTFSFLVGNTGQQYTNTLKLWCGENIKGNPGERLRPAVDKTAHYIAVQVEGTDHGAQVLFESNQCTFEYGEQHNIEKNQQAITINGQTIYIAKTWVKLPDDLVPDGTYLPCLVKASQEVASNDVQILIYGINDGEKSHNISTYTHQTNTFGEILGDNYFKILDGIGNEVIDYGSESDYKDIMIELDWYKWEDNVDITDIQEIAQLVKQILYTAGIDTLNSIFIGNEISDMPDPTTRKQRMSLLAEHKAPLEEQRLWLNKIHVILGSKGEVSEKMGITEMYPASGEIFNIWHTMHLGSGGLSFATPYLDSTGCFVFAKNIADYPGLLITVNKAIALVAAHEIGHALGMWHYDNIPNVGYIKNVMNSNIQVAFTTLNGFALYGFFDKRTLDGSYDTNNYTNDGMNTRNVLGIDCVNSIHEGS